MVGLGVHGEDGVPGEDVSVGHFVEHAAGVGEESEFGVEIDEVVGEVDGGEAGFDDEGVD